MIGENNVGKTALIEALRSLLAGHEEPYSRFNQDDLHRPKSGDPPSGDITFLFVFSGLSTEDEADFLQAIVPNEQGGFDAYITVSYSLIDPITGRMRPRRWCGEFEDIALSSDILENLRGVYLPPLRDASQGLKPGRSSQMAKLLRLMGSKDQSGKDSIEQVLGDYDQKLQETQPIKDAQTAITDRHENMLGNQLSQDLSVGLSATDFNRLSARISIQADAFDIDQNGLGYNNLIYMAVVLNEMVHDPSVVYRGLIVEEPEAHLHPQLQYVLLNYLQDTIKESIEGDLQIFVTSHSPNFASIADLDSVMCLIESDGNISTFLPRKVVFDKSKAEHLKKRKKLDRYLDITRAELFFARRIIFVEGAAELFLINAFAKYLGKKFNIRQNAVSVISVEGLNFDSFLPLFGENSFQIPVSIITDADPPKKDKIAVFPDLDGDIILSDNTKKLKEKEDSFVKVYCGVKTLEYDLALHEQNRKIMLQALAETNPGIAKDLQKEVDENKTNREKAKALYCGMFERGETKTNVQKGRYAQELALILEDRNDIDFVVPSYIKYALTHVCNP